LYIVPNASWSEFLRQLQYKQEAIGGKFVKIDRFFPSSKTCSKCGFIVDSMSLNVREWNCPKCGAKHDRDVNAAKVILQQAEERLDAEGSKTNRKKGVPVEA
jgi:putative transposase